MFLLNDVETSHRLAQGCRRVSSIDDSDYLPLWMRFTKATGVSETRGKDIIKEYTPKSLQEYSILYSQSKS
jgi:hypothetical protein